MLFLVVFVSSISINAQNLIAAKYLQVKPGVSTRDDVEKILGKHYANGYDKYTAYYKAEEVVFSVYYSNGKCESEYEDWNLSEWTVERVYINVTDGHKLRLKDVILELSKFKKQYVGDVIGQIEFSNENAGISIIYFKTSKTVQDMEVTLTPEQKKNFACPVNKK